MLTPEQIQQRITSYACCSLNALYEYVQSRIYGENKCAEEKWRMYLYLKWAKAKMCDPCLSPEEKTCIADKADCYCDPCGCPQPPEEDCIITPQFIVLDAIPFDDLPAEPEDGDSYYIIEGDFTGRIAVWDADASLWTYTIVGVFNVVLSQNGGTYWVNTGNGPNLLFPTITIELVSGLDTWRLTQDGSDVSQGRTIWLEGLGPNGWYAMWQGNENDIPIDINLFGLPFTEVRARYILDNGCEYTTPGGTTIPEIDPGTGDPVCGTIEHDTDVVVNEVTGAAAVTVTLSNNQGYPLGPITYVLNGGETQTLGQWQNGANFIGNFPPGSTVAIIITNTADPTCNIELDLIEVDCGTVDVATEIVQNCGATPGDAGIPVGTWGVIVTLSNPQGFALPAIVSWETPLDSGSALDVAPNVFGCGPISVEDDPGPMTITVEAQNSKLCPIVLGPFSVDACCPVADATIAQVLVDSEPYFRVTYNSTDPVEVGSILWAKNGIPQTAVTVDGTLGNYDLGPLEDGDVVTIILTNEDEPDCSDNRGDFTVEFPQCAPNSLSITVTNSADAAINVLGTDGYVALVSPSGSIDVRENDNAQWDLTELGIWCVYPSDVNGNPSGTWEYVALGFAGIDPVDLSPINGSGPMADLTDVESIYIESVPWTSVALPSLVGTNAPFRMNSSTVTTVTVPASTKFRAVEIGAPLNSASVDALCNSLDPTVTGQVTQFVGTAPATAASLPNRLAYIANGNTITFS